MVFNGFYSFFMCFCMIATNTRPLKQRRFNIANNRNGASAKHAFAHLNAHRPLPNLPPTTHPPTTTHTTITTTTPPPTNTTNTPTRTNTHTCTRRHAQHQDTHTHTPAHTHTHTHAHTPPPPPGPTNDIHQPRTPHAHTTTTTTPTTNMKTAHHQCCGRGTLESAHWTCTLHILRVPKLQSNHVKQDVIDSGMCEKNARARRRAHGQTSHPAPPTQC